MVWTCACLGVTRIGVRGAIMAFHSTEGAWGGDSPRRDDKCVDDGCGHLASASGELHWEGRHVLVCVWGSGRSIYHVWDGRTACTGVPPHCNQTGCGVSKQLNRVRLHTPQRLSVPGIQ